MSPEVPGEVRLIVEANLRGDLRERLTIEQPAPGGIDPAPDDVPVRRDPERTREAPEEVRRRNVQDPAGLGERRGVGPRTIQQIPQSGCDLRDVAVHGFGRSVTEMTTHPLAHGHELRLGLERRVGILKRAIEGCEPSNDHGILDVGPVDGRTDQPLSKDLHADVEHPLAVPAFGRCPTVVNHMRRQDRDALAGSAAMPELDVVPDRSLVDHEERPRVVGVPRVGVIREARMEDLVDPGHRGLPGANPLAGGGQDVQIVQDPRLAPVLAGPMHELVGLVAFAFVGSASPGPNNTLLWASGMRFGFRRTAPHVLGTALGIGALAIAVVAGLGALISAVPAVDVALKILGSAYLLFLAYLVLGTRAVGGTHVARPLSLVNAVGFQFVNPKAWIFAVAAVGTFLPADPHPRGVIVLTVTMMGIVIGSSSMWAAAGTWLGRVVADERSLSVINGILAALLVASVALIWI
jgi:threonine/homoserine/homoserine lactone efflux protein